MYFCPITVPNSVFFLTWCLFSKSHLCQARCDKCSFLLTLSRFIITTLQKWCSYQQIYLYTFFIFSRNVGNLEVFLNSYSILNGSRSPRGRGPHLFLMQLWLRSCWPSSYNWNLVQPTQKRFNSAYFQNKFCICRKMSSNT